MRADECFGSRDTFDDDAERRGRPPAALMKRLRARIARRPGRWRKRMHTKKGRGQEGDLPFAA